MGLKNPWLKNKITDDNRWYALYRTNGYHYVVFKGVNGFSGALMTVSDFLGGFKFDSFDEALLAFKRHVEPQTSDKWYIAICEMVPKKTKVYSLNYIREAK